MSRRAIGIEWRDRTLTIVVTERARDTVEVVRARARDWPEEEPLTPGAVRAFCESEEIPRGTATLVVSGSAAAAKPLILPPVPLEEQRRILRENGDRYFLFPVVDRVYDLFELDDAQGGDDDARTQMRWAVAAAAPDVEALMEGLGAAGVFVRAVTAAECVYPAAVSWLTGESGDLPEHVVRVAGEHVDRVRYRAGGVAEAESWEPGREDLPGPLSDLVLADPGTELPTGTAAVPPREPIERPGTFGGALGAALVHGASVAGPDLIPAAVRGARERVNRLRTLGLSAAAAVLLLLAGYLAAGERADREARIQEELERTRAEATAVLALKEELDTIRRRLATFQAARAGQHRYGRVLITMTEALPAHAWIVSFVSSEPDQAVVSGYARSATDALTSLTRAPLFTDVRFDRPTRSVELGDQPFEAFTMALLFAPDPAAGGGTRP